MGKRASFKISMEGENANQLGKKFIECPVRYGDKVVGRVTNVNIVGEKMDITFVITDSDALKDLLDATKPISISCK